MGRNIAACLHIFLFLLIEDSSGQKFKFGSCRNIPAIKNFVPATFGTTWYEYSRTPSIHDQYLRCNTFIYTYNAATTTFTARFTAINTNTGNEVKAVGTVTLPAGTTIGVLGVKIPNSVLNLKANIFVVGMDTANPPLWVAFYTCKDFGIGRIEKVVILTSLRIPTAATVTAANDALTALGLTTIDLLAVNQVDC